jgi:nicotinamide riboside transporter PnuC
MSEAIGWVATALAVAGCVCINRRLRAGFVCWILANGLSWYLHAEAGMLAMIVRDAVFTVLAVSGWWAWGRGEAAA